MKPVGMLVHHSPSEGIYGDCQRACIASLLEVPASVVPHCYDYGDEVDPTGETGARKLNQWLAKFGLCLLEVFVPYPYPEGMIDRMVLGHHVMVGLSPRGCQHAVVGFRGGQVHDPHPSGLGVEPMESKNQPGVPGYMFGFLCKL